MAARKSPPASDPLPASGDAPAPEPEVTADLPTNEAGSTEPSPGASPEAEQVSFRDAFQARGFDVRQFADDDALLEHVVGEVQRARQIPDLARKAQYFDYLAPYAGEIEKLIQAKQAPSPPAGQAAAPAETPYWEKPPEWDPLWERGLEWDEDGKSYRAAAGFHPDLPRKYAARKEWERRAAARLLDDPAAVVREGLKADFDSLKAEARRIAQEELAAYRQEQHVNAFVLENSHWLYEQDGQGRPKFDPATSQPIFSARGAQFAQLTQQLAAAGTRPEYIPSLAMQIMGQQPPSLAAAGGGSQAGPPGTPPGETLREQFIAGSQFAPGRGGGQLSPVAQPGGVPPGPDEDIRTMLARAMEQAGVTTTDPPAPHL